VTLKIDAGYKLLDGSDEMPYALNVETTAKQVRVLINGITYKAKKKGGVWTVNPYSKVNELKVSMESRESATKG
jgi:hypothetical protein